MAQIMVSDVALDNGPVVVLKLSAAGKVHWEIAGEERDVIEVHKRLKRQYHDEMARPTRNYGDDE